VLGNRGRTAARLAAVVGLALRMAAGLAAPAAALTPTPTTTPAITPVLPPGPFQLAGHVASDRTCNEGVAGATVRLDPVGLSVTTSAVGSFAFDDVPGGTYTVSVEPNCEPVPCYAPLQVVLDRDVSVAICYEVCTEPTLTPSAVPPGAVVDVIGYCQPSEIGRHLQVHLGDEVVAEPVVDGEGVYRASFGVPQVSRATIGLGVNIFAGDELVGTGNLTIVNQLAPCVGDCDGDWTVSVDEILRGVREALGLAPVSTCPAMDETGNGTISIAELVAAVDRALNGCRAPDLVPISAAFSRCAERTCTGSSEPSLFMNVCVANQGDADAGLFYVQQGMLPAVFVAGLAAGGEACIELPFASDVSVRVDVGDMVPERDETNNELQLTLPIPTACDVVGPACTPTPPPSPTPT
jgi:hypothetical protein